MKPMGPARPARSLYESEQLLKGARAQDDFWAGVRTFWLALFCIIGIPLAVLLTIGMLPGTIRWFFGH